MYSTVEDLLKFDNAISITSYFRKHNRIDDLPKKTLDNVALDFGMLMVMEFSTLNLFIALVDSWFDLQLDPHA
jgi:hypothetical protein